MYKWEPYNLNNPFITRQGESIVDLAKYSEVLKKNNIPFTEDQYNEAKKKIDKQF
ncbi:hypothetical protein [Clostridium tertium]